VVAFPVHSREKSTAVKYYLQMFCECYILHETTAYLQHVFNMLKHSQNDSHHFCTF